MTKTWVLKPKISLGAVDEGDIVDGSVISVRSFLAADDPSCLPMRTTVDSGKTFDSGNLGDWFSVETQESPWSEIRLEGDFPWLDRLGGAQPGASLGMNGGRIVVKGSVGNLVGHRMRRGEIFVDGGVGDHVGSRMIAGTILVTGNVGSMAMVSASRGTLIHDHSIAVDVQHFSRPMHAMMGYAALVRTRSCDQGIRKLLDRCSRSGVTVRRGDRLVGGQAELVQPR